MRHQRRLPSLSGVQEEPPAVITGALLQPRCVAGGEHCDGGGHRDVSDARKLRTVPAPVELPIADGAERSGRVSFDGEMSELSKIAVLVRASVYA